MIAITLDVVRPAVHARGTVRPKKTPRVVEGDVLLIEAGPKGVQVMRATKELGHGEATGTLRHLRRYVCLRIPDYHEVVRTRTSATSAAVQDVEVLLVFSYRVTRGSEPLMEKSAFGFFDKVYRKNMRFSNSFMTFGT